MNKPELHEQVGAAIFIALYGAENTGAMTLDKLMWPHTRYEPDDVKRAAARLLASVHTALLTTLPPIQIELISTDQASYLSFALADGWPDESNPSAKDG